MPIVDNKINGMPWFSLVGLPASFTSQIYGNDEIPLFFRSNNFENNAAKLIMNNRPMEVVVLNFYKSGVFQKNKGVVGYYNDSIGQGYGPGTLFLKAVKGLIEEYCHDRGMEVTGGKEGVNLIVKVSGGRLPKNFSADLRKLIYKNRDKFVFKSHNKTFNLLDVLGENSLNIRSGYTVILPNKHIPVDKIKGAIMALYENVKFKGFTGKAEMDDLLKTVEKNGIKVKVNDIYGSLDQVAISNDYVTHNDLFEKSLKMLPDEYVPLLELAWMERKIFRSTFDYLKMINMKFVDVKYGCLNEDGIHLAMERAQMDPARAMNVIGITGADELSGQLIIDGKAYSFSLDITNLGGINREYGVEAGDQFIAAHIKAFDEVKKMINDGRITKVDDVFIEYYKTVNSQTIKIRTAAVSKKGKGYLSKKNMDMKGDHVETKIINLMRAYAKDKNITKRVDTGASATVVVTGIIGVDRRGVLRVVDFMKNEVKKLKSTIAGKAGQLLIEVREYGLHQYKSTLIKVDGDKQVTETRTVQIEPKGEVPVNGAKVPAKPSLKPNISLVPGPLAGGASGLFAGAVTYPLKLAFNGDLNKFSLTEWGKESAKSGWIWTVFGSKTMLLEKYAGFAKGAVPIVITMDQLTGIALAPDGQKGRQAVVGGASLASFLAGMKVGNAVASKIPAPAPVKGAIALFGGIVASEVGEKGMQELMPENSGPVLEGVGKFLSPLGMATPEYWWQKEVNPYWTPATTTGKVIKAGAETATDIGVTVAEWKLARALFKFAAKKLPGLAGRTLTRLGGIPLLALWLAQQELLIIEQRTSLGAGES